jgi:cardiolipin synthase (CMP-forming)
VTRADIPNLISMARVFLVLPTVMALLNEQFLLALLLYTIAGISDGLDGYIAKRYNYISRLGSILDPLADKLLLVATYVALAWLELLPVWLAVAVVARDLLILIGAGLYHLLIGKYEMEPTLISKLNTVAQIMLGLLTVFSAGVYALPEQLMDWLILFVLGTTLLSGLDYMWIWGRRAWRARSEPSS